MFNYDTLIDIADLEVFLFEGPEKDNDTNQKDRISNKNIWYSYEINQDTGDIEYKIFNNK
jgi:hypothetical protein